MFAGFTKTKYRFILDLTEQPTENVRQLLQKFE